MALLCFAANMIFGSFYDLMPAAIFEENKLNIFHGISLSVFCVVVKLYTFSAHLCTIICYLSWMCTSLPLIYNFKQGRNHIWIFFSYIWQKTLEFLINDSPFPLWILSPLMLSQYLSLFKLIPVGSILWFEWLLTFMFSSHLREQ